MPDPSLFPTFMNPLGGGTGGGGEGITVELEELVEVTISDENITVQLQDAEPIVVTLEEPIEIEVE